MDVTTLGAGWILGHAARTNRIFHNAGLDRSELFLPGCFRDIASEIVALGIDHDPCRCKDPGRSSKTESREALLYWPVVLASTRDKTLLISEDAYGLSFATTFPDAEVSLHRGGAPVNIHDAVAQGTCLGLSIHHHGGDWAIRAALPSDVFAWERAHVVEISLMFSESPACPGTWVMRAGPDAIREYNRRLRRIRAQVN